MTSPQPSRLPLALWIAAMGLVAVGAAVDLGSLIPATGDVWINIGLVIAYPAAGVLILRNRPRHRVGWLMTAIGISCAVTFASHAIAVYGIVLHPSSIPGAPAAAWLNEWVWTTGTMPAVALLPAFFPDGRLPNWPARAAAVAGGSAIAMLAVGAAFRPEPFENFPSVRNPVGITPLGGLLEGLQLVGFPLFLLATIAALVSVFVRWRRGDTSERRQLNWFLAATAFLVATVVLDSTGSVPAPVGAALATVAPGLIAAAVVVAIVRYRLYDVDVIVNRSLVYVALTALLVATYAIGVATLGAVFGRFGGSVATTAAVAITFDPARRRVQAVVDRLLYGDRSALDSVLRELADRLAAATTPASALRAVTDAAVDALGAPGATAAIVRDNAVVAAQTTGAMGDHAEAHPITLRGERVGELTIAVRRGDERPTRRRRRQLAAATDRLVRAAELAAATVLLTAELQQSRADAVAAREEERRRIRRDLHDGLGPRLAGLALGIESVQAADATRSMVLGALASEAYATIEEVRALVHDLRPSALDDLGLVRAVRECAAALAPSGASTAFDIEAPDELPALPAAIEVAAFRIATEAMTNVVRHAAAQSCTVTIEAGLTELSLTIDDDGVGINGHPPSRGLGLESMRERAIEVGGTFAIAARAPRGTTVVARLPRTP